jgi:NAD(P)-dependent dehydrogenase (short-subunit alcohol dehydrogenase family)
VQGKTIVITGATSGIGRVAAYSLAQQGARIVAVARDRQRGEETLSELRRLAPARNHAVHYADLSLLAEMQRVAEQIAASEQQIDVLINNAGALFSTRQLTADGLEMSFATNHMAYFVLTNLLGARLKATAGARVISTASDAYKMGRVRFDDLQSRRSYSAFGMYGSSKLMNILFTRELAARLGAAGVTANCFYPGFVATRFGDASSGLMPAVFRFAKKFAITPEAGARTLIYLASAPQVAGSTGQYFYKCQPVALFKRATNDADARRLWEISAELAGLGATL